MQYNRSLFIFRQDLRLTDNTALLEAVKASREVIPVFILDSEVLQHSPTGDPRLWFLLDALVDLDTQLIQQWSWLIVSHGPASSITIELAQLWWCDAVYRNRSYGSLSLTRDKEIIDRCQTNDIFYGIYDDYLLVAPEALPAMKVFTPWKKRWYTYMKDHPIVVAWIPSLPPLPHLHHSSTHTIRQSHIALHHHAIARHIHAWANTHRPIDKWKERLSSFAFDQYDATRNTPSINGSSQLSPYTRFGLISIRQLASYIMTAWQTAGWSADSSYEVYLAELGWREFWHHIMHYFPEMRYREFQEKRRHIARWQDQTLLDAWCEGRTGYPLVDAGMRQLIAMNWMHNRVRMVVASFLTKDLLIDRRLGDQHFRRYLIDYDENIDIGNRQRSASVGADPKPLRIFNPSLQAQRFDPEAIYIRQWIPELRDAPLAAILHPEEHDLTPYGYPAPIVTHKIQSAKAKAMYYGSSV